MDTRYTIGPLGPRIPSARDSARTHPPPAHDSKSALHLQKISGKLAHWNRCPYFVSEKEGFSVAGQGMALDEAGSSAPAKAAARGRWKSNFWQLSPLLSNVCK